MITTLLLVASVVCLLLAAFGVNFSRVQTGWLGVFFFVLTFLVGG